MLYPSTRDIWTQNRDTINLVIGGILSAYLGLSLSKQGLSQGSSFDLFALIIFTAYAAGSIVTSGDRWFFGNRKLGIFFALSSIPSAWISVVAAHRLGVEKGIFVTIYVAWAFLIIGQIMTYELAEFVKKKND